MPIEEIVFDESPMGETESLVAWMNRELVPTAAHIDCDDDPTNDSTLSGSCLLAAMEEIQNLPCNNKLLHTPLPPDSASRDGGCVWETQEDSASTAMTDQENFENSPFVPPPLGPTILPREKGSKEMEYHENYKYKVSRWIRDFQNRHPGKLKEYPRLSREEKANEEERVTRLLARLHIGEPCAASNSTRQKGCLLERQDSDATMDMFVANDDSTVDEADDTILPNPSLTLLSPAAASTRDDDGETPSPRETSMALLTPAPLPIQHDSEGCVGDSDSSQSSSPKRMPPLDGDSDSSVESIEQARSKCQLLSPHETIDWHHRKRMATTSGKRGMDMTRMRTNNTPKGAHEEANSSLDDESLEDSFQRLSVGPSHVFTASQSPIFAQKEETSATLQLHQEDDSDDEGGFVERDISIIDDDVGPYGASSDSELSSRDEIRETMSGSFDERGGRLPLSTLPGVALKRGVAFHLDPLETRRRQRTAPPTQTFPDPFDSYNDRMRQCMLRVYRWIRQREKEGGAVGTIASMREAEIADLVLRIALRDRRTPDSTEQVDTQQTVTSSKLCVGNILIVTREKASLEKWSRVFREKSSLSVLNHSAIPAKERKSPSIAVRCSKFGVVLSTFDALRAPDTTVYLSDSGCVQQDRRVDEDGWFCSRSNSQQSGGGEQHKQLSVLHLVHWTRVIFVDIVGRKSFLGKPGTTRHVAARALGATTRTLFLLNEKDGVDAETFFQSDRKVIQSLASILRLDCDVTGVPQEIAFLDRAFNFRGSGSIRQRPTKQS